MSKRPGREYPAQGRIGEPAKAPQPLNLASWGNLRASKGGGRWLTSLLLFGLPIAFLALFFYYPIIRVLAEALFRPDIALSTPPTDAPGFSLARSPLWNTLGDPFFWRLLRLTTEQALYSTLASVMLGLPFAYVLANYRFPLRDVVRTLTLVPFVLPSVSVALGFILFFGQQGLFNEALFAITGHKVRVLYSLPAIVMAHAFYNAPVVARSLYASWERLDPSYEESACSLGAGRWARFRDVTLPLLFPGLVTGSLLAFIFSFMSFPIVLTLGGSRFSTLEVEIFTQVRVLLDYSTGAALALIQTTFSLFFAYMYLLGEARFTSEVGGVRERPLRPLFKLAPANIVLCLFLACGAAFYLGPVGAVIVDSLQGPGGTWSLEAYRTVLSPDHNALVGDHPPRAIANSLRFATRAVLIALPLAAALALGLSRFAWRGRRFLEALALAPLAVSSVAFGFGMLRTFRAGPFSILGGELSIAIAHAVLAFPFVLRVLRPLFEQLDRSWREAARSLGANSWQAFRHVELPLTSAGLLVATTLAFAISLAEMSATIMLAHPGLMTMPLSLYHLLAARHFGAASAMAVVLMGATALAFFLIERLGQRAVRSLYTRTSAGETGRDNKRDPG